MTGSRPAGLSDRLVTGAGVFGISARTQWEETRTSPFVVLLNIVQPTVFLLISLLPQDRPGAAEATRVTFGVILTSFWGSTVWAAAGILRRERAAGTLARTLTGVHDPRLVVLGKSFGATAISLVSVTVTVTLLLLLLRQPVALGGAGWLLVGAATVVVSGSAVGMLIGCLFVASRYGPQLSSVLMYPVFLLGGMLIPVSLIPAGLSWISWLVSLRWLQEFFVSSGSGSADLGALGAALLLTACYAVIGAALFARVVNAARREGSLDLL